jgi:dynein heavy chain 2
MQSGALNRKDPVALYLIKQVEVYFKLYPLLKLVVGEAFEPEHWNALFSLLKLKDMKREKLLFNDLLGCDKVMIK